MENVYLVALVADLMIAERAGIDQDKLEAEKRQMLEVCRRVSRSNGCRPSTDGPVVRWDS